MLPTLVIGLREGLEAALIVGIIAAFLRKQGRGDLLRAVFVGVGAAVLLCAGVGVLLDTVSQNLPQRQQEGLEAVIGALAVGMVTYMVVWTKRHSRRLKGQLEGLAADAMTSSGGGTSRAGWAMVAMAFLAVLREGLETAVFLVAAFNETGSGAGAAAGALLGVAAAVALGYGIYRGGVRINLSKFFRVTGLVLVLVAAGLVVNALHTAHEAGWLQVGQSSTVDLSRLVNPGSVQSSLLIGMLGIQTHPVLIEVVGWFLYLVPVGLFVAWPPGRPVPLRRLAVTLSVVTAALMVGAGVLALVRPSQVDRPVFKADQVTARLLAVHGSYADVRFQGRKVTVRRAGTRDIAGVKTVLYDARTPTPVAGRPAALPVDQVARLNGGRLPLGVRPGPEGTVPVRYTGARVFTVAVEPRTGRVVDVRGTETVTAAAAAAGEDVVPLADPVSSARSELPAAVRNRAAATAGEAVQQLDDRAALGHAAVACLLLAVPALLGALALFAAVRRAATNPSDGEPEPAAALVKS